MSDRGILFSAEQQERLAALGWDGTAEWLVRRADLLAYEVGLPAEWEGEERHGGGEHWTVYVELSQWEGRWEWSYFGTDEDDPTAFGSSPYRLAAVEAAMGARAAHLLSLGAKLPSEPL